MRYSSHQLTIVLLFVGVAVAIALSMASGFWIDAHRPLGSRGVIAFLLASGAIFICVEAVAGASGEWLERRRLHRGLRRG